MDKYEVIEGFIDSVEGKGYRANETFVVGPKTDKKRLQSLTTDKNKQGRPLIRHVRGPKVKQGE